MMNEKAKEALAQFRALPKPEQCQITLNNKTALLVKRAEAVELGKVTLANRIAAEDAKIAKYHILIQNCETRKVKAASTFQRLNDMLVKANEAREKAAKALEKALNPPVKAPTKKELDTIEAQKLGLTLEAYRTKVKAEKAEAIKAEKIATQTVGVKNGIADRNNPPAATQPTTSEKAASQADIEALLAKLTQAGVVLTQPAQVAA